MVAVSPSGYYHEVMADESNVIPIRDGIEVSPPTSGEATAAEEFQKAAADIVGLRQEGLQVMSRLVMYWADTNPKTREMASAAISDIVEATQMRPPTSS